MRNGDYTPTRLEAQKDAVNLIFSSKTNSNPENTVGLLTMAGKGYVQREQLLFFFL
jgi:26S proteasome regulatory subunit N10